MVSPYIWGIVPALGAVTALKAATSRRGTRRRRDRLDGYNDGIDGGTDPNFICERVCTSNRLMRRMGGLAKDITPNTCVTVCGVSALDSCTEACQQAVCTSMHQVPAWNEACITRCSTECQRGRGSS